MSKFNLFVLLPLVPGWVAGCSACRAGELGSLSWRPVPAGLDSMDSLSKNVWLWPDNYNRVGNYLNHVSVDRGRRV